jgi:hypothetical protein
MVLKTSSLMLNADGSLTEETSAAIQGLFLAIGERLRRGEFGLPADIHLEIEVDHWDWRISARIMGFGGVGTGTLAPAPNQV